MTTGPIIAALLLASCDQVFDLDRPVVAPDAPLSCPSTYRSMLGGNYRVSTTQKTWIEAKTDCRLDDVPELTGRTHLVVTSTLLEMKALATGEYFWFGLTDTEQEGLFSWISAENETITPRFPIERTDPWATGEPSNSGIGGEDCAVLAPQGTLNDVGCDESNFFICECDVYPERSLVPDNVLSR